MLEGEKVVLVPIKNEDTDKILYWRNQEFVRDKFIDQAMLTQETHRKWLDSMVAKGKVEQFIIYAKTAQDRIAIGSVYLKDVDRNNRKAEYGIFIGEKEYLGKGFGSDAAKVILKYAFQVLLMHKVFLRVLASNEYAIKSYKKVGFIEEGYFRDEVRIQNDYRDVIFMAILG